MSSTDPLAKIKEAGVQGLPLSTLSPEQQHLLLSQSPKCEVIQVHEATGTFECIRLHPSSFIEDVKTRFKFSRKEYLSILNALFEHPNGISGAELRQALGIDARDFFYFIKKLRENDILTKDSSGTIKLGRKPLSSPTPCFSPSSPLPLPSSLLHNVPIYKQVYHRLTNGESLSTREVSRLLGISVKLSLKVLNKILAENRGRITTTGELDGKTKRIRFLSKEAHREIKSGVFREREREREKATSLPVLVEERQRALEEIVRRRECVLIDPELYKELSSSLKASFTMDKRTILRVAKKLEEAGKLQVLRITQKRKKGASYETIGRSLLLHPEMDVNAPKVEGYIKKSGYKHSVIHSKSGIIHISSKSLPEKEENKENETENNGSNLLFAANYPLNALAEGYTPSLSKRLLILVEHLLSLPAGSFSVDYSLINTLPLSSFFSLFFFALPGFQSHVYSLTPPSSTYKDLLSLNDKDVNHRLSLRDFPSLIATNYLERLHTLKIVEFFPDKKSFTFLITDLSLIGKSLSKIRSKSANRTFIPLPVRKDFLSLLKDKTFHQSCDVIKSLEVSVPTKQSLILLLSPPPSLLPPIPLTRDCTSNIAFYDNLISIESNTVITVANKVIETIKADKEVIEIEESVLHIELAVSSLIHHKVIAKPSKYFFLAKLCLSPEYLGREGSIAPPPKEFRASPLNIPNPLASLVYNYLLYNGSAFSSVLQAKLCLLPYEVEDAVSSTAELQKQTDGEISIT